MPKTVSIGGTGDPGTAKKRRGKGKKNPDQNSTTTTTSDNKRKIWTQEELNKMAEYIVQVNGKIVPRSSLIRNMKQALGWTDISEIQIGNKWDQLHKQYTDTNKWRNETGQGVKESDGEMAFHAALLKRCPQFDTLDAVLGTKAAVNAPAFVQSQGPSSISNKSPEPMDEIPGDDYEEEFNFETLEFERVDSPPKPKQPISPAVASDSEEITTGASVFRESLRKAQQQSSKEVPKSGQDRIAYAYEKKAAVEDEKLKLLREEFSFKKKLEQDKLTLSGYEVEQRSKNAERQTVNNYKLEVARLTQDPELLKSLVTDCLTMESTVPAPPKFMGAEALITETDADETNEVERPAINPNNN